MIKLMGLETIYMQMEQDTWETGIKTSKMALVKKIGLTALGTLESIKKEKNKARETFSGLMVADT